MTSNESMSVVGTAHCGTHRYFGLGLEHLAGTGEERQLLDNLRRWAGDPSQPPRTKWGPPLPPWRRGGVWWGGWCCGRARRVRII